MTDGRSSRGGEPVATLTITSRKGEPDLVSVEAALHSLYPQHSHKIEHRAVSLGDEIQIVFEVFVV